MDGQVVPRLRSGGQSASVETVFKWGPAFCFWPQPINSTLNPGLIGDDRGRDEESVESEKSQKKKNDFLPPKKLENIAQTSIFEVPHLGRIDWYQKFQSWSYSDQFHQTIHVFPNFWLPQSPKIWKCFETNHYFLKESGPGTHRKWKITKFCIGSTYQKLRQP